MFGQMFEPMDEQLERLLGFRFWEGNQFRIFSSAYLEHEPSCSRYAQKVLKDEIDAVVRDCDSNEGKSQEAYLDCVFRKSRGLLYGPAFEEDKDMEETEQGKNEKTAIFEHLGSVENLKCLLLKMKRVLLWASVDGSFVLSDSENYRQSVRLSFLRQDWEALECLIMPLAVALLGRTAVVFAVALLLSLVYRYLVGVVDNGRTKTYSPGSLEFRSTYISIVLFQGAYVWIKSRDVAPPSQQRPSPGLHRKSRVIEGVKEWCGNFEPRFKPRGWKDKPVYVGVFEEEEDAKTMYKILAFYYGKNNGLLNIVDHDPYVIAPMTEQEQQLVDAEKREWVKLQAKIVYDDYQLFLTLFNLPPLVDTNAILGSEDGGDAVGLGSLDDGFVSPRPSNCVGAGMQQVVDGSASGEGCGMQLVIARDPLALQESSMVSHSETAPAPDPPACESAGPSGCLEFPHQSRCVQDHLAKNPAINVDSDYFSLPSELREMRRRQELQDQQLLHQVSEWQLKHQQQEDRISELLGEVERIRNSERVCKRCRCDITS